MYILSWRHDALTERLNSVVNGMYLSKLLNLDFRFTWPEFRVDSMHHVIPARPEDLFSRAFIRAYYLEEKAIAVPGDFDVDNILHRRSQTLGTSHSSQRFDTLSKRGFDFFLAPLRRPEPVARESVFTNVVNIFKHEMFTGHIQAALDTAYALAIEPGTTALHFRCGDVIYGKARYWGRFARDKSLCLPVARYLLEHINPGRGKILFGGSDKELNLLRGNGSDHILAKEKLAGIPDGSAGLLAEVVLMSKCGQVLCSGGSGVTCLAQSIGKVEKLDVRALLSVEQEYRAIREYVSDGGSDDLHRAFAAYNGFILSWESGRKESLDLYLEIAGRCDGENPLYPALRLLVAMAEDNIAAFSKAHLELGRLWSGELRREDFASLYLRFIRRKKNNGTPVVPELIAEIRALHTENGGLKGALDVWLARLGTL